MPRYSWLTTRGPIQSFSHPPETQTRVKTFDPRALDRSVIAIPLLQKIEEELAQIKSFEAEHDFDRRKFNTLIEYNRDYSGTMEEMWQRVVHMAKEAADKALKASKKRLKDLKETLPARQRLPNDAARNRTAIYGNVFLMEKRRHAALKAAIDKQKIGPLVEKGFYGFAGLHAAVIRRLIAANDQLSASDEDKPIIRIHPTRYEVIIDLNLDYPGGRNAAHLWVFENIKRAKENVDIRDAGQDVHLKKDQRDSDYIFAQLETRVIKELIDLDIREAKKKAEGVESANSDPGSGHSTIATKVEPSKYRAIFRIWPDFEISSCINKSIATVKTDAAQNSFSAHGAGITWAVMDSGIKQDHEHFRKHRNIDPESKWHKDFTMDGSGPFDNENEHSTHIAGIIAGEWHPPTATAKITNTLTSFDADILPARIPIAVSHYLKKDSENIEYQAIKLTKSMSGMAPRCKLVNLRVLDENGKGTMSNLIAAIGHMQEINGYERKLLIHNVNMSLGYAFEPE